MIESKHIVAATLVTASLVTATLVTATLVTAMYLSNSCNRLHCHLHEMSLLQDYYSV